MDGGGGCGSGGDGNSGGDDDNMEGVSQMKNQSRIGYIYKGHCSAKIL